MAGSLKATYFFKKNVGFFSHSETFSLLQKRKVDRRGRNPVWYWLTSREKVTVEKWVNTGYEQGNCAAVERNGKWRRLRCEDKVYKSWGTR